MKVFKIQENGINMVWKVADTGCVRLLHFSALPFDERTIVDEYEEQGFKLLELEAAGYDRPDERHGTKYIVTAPGYRMQYADHKDYRNETGRKLEITTQDQESGLQAVNHFQFFDGIAVVRCWCEVSNMGKETQTIQYVSTFNLNGVEKEGLLSRDEKIRIGVVHNSWQRELLLQEYTLPEVSQSVVITRMEGRTPVPAKEKVAAFASHNATMVLFLSTGLLEKLEGQLIEGGYKEDTPAAIVYKATWPEEESYICTVSTLAETAKAHGITKTALIIVGDVVTHHAYERSKLYDPEFTTEFRQGVK